MKKILLTCALLSLGTATAAFGQIVVTPGMTPQQYVEDVLIGSGVTVSNITFTGLPQQIARFNGTASNIGFADGIVLSSGEANDLEGSAFTDPTNQFGQPGDPDLLEVAQSVTTNPNASLIQTSEDAAILEFDFVPTSNFVSFNFVFGSDEYTTYINTTYNDAFGFFISGPGITGPYASPAGFPDGAVNLALVPGTTTPITISTIHPGLNSGYYISNVGGTTHTLNGFTTPIPVQFPVICGETYHFKFAVSDCQDDFLDTDVFLEAGSFTSPPVQFSISTPDGDNTVNEGCLGADLVFVRNACQADDSITVSYLVSGTATEGTDFAPLENPFIMVPGQDTAIINVLAFADGITEGTEYLTVTLEMVNEEGDTIVISGTLAIEDSEPLSVGPNDVNSYCLGDDVVISVTPSGGIGAYSYDWNTGATTSQITEVYSANGVYTYTVEITDECNGYLLDTITVTVNQTLAIDTIYTYHPSACNPDGAVAGMIVGQTGQPQYHWTGPGNPGSNNIDASVLQNIPGGWYYFTVTDNVCTISDSAQLIPQDPPIAQFSASALSGCSPLNVTFTNTSQNANSYQWNFGNGQTANVNDLSSQSQTYTDNAIVQLIAVQGTCTDTMTLAISISVCGCTDPEAINYNPSATVNDGSCVYPQPTVEVPNVFTPNGDGDNDVFELKVTNADKVELIITNRWGNVMYSQTGAAPKWDGKAGDVPAEEGVYFYTYKVFGLETTLEGHGFLQLIID